MGYTPVKQDDTEPTEAALSDRKGPVPLPEGTQVLFAMRQQEGAKMVTRNCQIVGDGEVLIPWAEGDLDTPGLYDGEFQVTFPNGNRKTFPNAGYETIDVQGDIAAP